MSYWILGIVYVGLGCVLTVMNIRTIFEVMYLEDPEDCGSGFAYLVLISILTWPYLLWKSRR